MNPVILRVAVPSPLRRWFDYLPPDDIDPTTLRPGIRLRVPFGRRSRVGVLCEIRTDSPLEPERLRPALTVLDREPLLPAAELELLLWAQRYYHHPPGEVLSTALPVLLRQGEAAEIRREPVWQLTDAGRTALSENRLSRAPRQRELCELLSEHPSGLSAERLRALLPNAADAARALAAKQWIEQVAAEPVLPPTSAELPDPTPAQRQAVDAVTGALGRFEVFLLEGVTGSGKTEVYLQIVQAVLDRGEQVLVLVPEISLTPQLLRRFERRLAVPLAVLHSALGDRERLNAWLATRAGEARVVIGTRSAVFTPLARPGVIIIDEEHDGSFKQQDGFRYHARDLAVMRAYQTGVPILLGSATPALESLDNAARGRYRKLELPDRVGGALHPHVELLDLRRQPLEEGLSPGLLGRVRQHLEQGDQVLLFLNRRGYAPSLICHECGWLGHCEHCDARLTLHLARRRLICHHCGSERALPAACPDCGSVDLRAPGVGTERIEHALARHFPAAGIARIDRDSTRRRGSLQRLLELVHSGQRRILLGTQMLAKGHHFPDVTLVGVIDADQGLFSADYRASERLAQLILQVAGRAGRAERPGTVIIQTHHPDHPLLLRLVNEGYPAFAAAALDERREAQLPPFTCQALLRAEAPQPEPPQRFLTEAAVLGKQLADEVELLGPVPAPMERRAGRHRFQLLLQAARRGRLHGFLEQWLDSIGTLPSARRVRWSLDVDPIDLF